MNRVPADKIPVPAGRPGGAASSGPPSTDRAYGMAAAELVARLRQVKVALFDFDGVFTDNKVIVCENGLENVVCSRGDGIGLKRLGEIGVRCLIISSEVNQVVAMRARKMGIECHINVEDKSQMVRSVLAGSSLAGGDAVFLGNDINDLAAMNEVGLAVAVADSVGEVVAAADLRLVKNGGDGAVRELCDLIYSARVYGSVNPPIP